jgi:uncharacterized protein YoxC
MTVTLDLMSILLGLLVIAGTVLLVYLIILIAKLAKALSQVNSMLE